jgi:cell division protein FtsB
MSHGQIFVLSIIAIVMVASMVKTFIRAKYGLTGLDGLKRGKRRFRDELSRENDFLLAENDRLKGSVNRLEERIAVLERIATDAPARLSAEIEKLK